MLGPRSHEAPTPETDPFGSTVRRGRVRKEVTIDLGSEESARARSHLDPGPLALTLIGRSRRHVTVQLPAGKRPSISAPISLPIIVSSHLPELSILERSWAPLARLALI